MEEGIMSKNRKTAIFFIHGGPGLSSSCFQGWFEQLEETYDLIFYDQNYDVPKGISIIESLCTELRNKVCDVAKKYDEIIVFAHSWGVYLLFDVWIRWRVPLQIVYTGLSVQRNGKYNLF